MIGKKTTIINAYGEAHDAEYRLMTLAALGLDPRFARDDRTPSEATAKSYEIARGFDPRQMISSSVLPNTGPPVVGPDWTVEAGSARTNALRFMRDLKTYSRYKEPLKVNAAEFGLDPERVSGMNEPVLVRMRRSELHGPAERARFARIANLSPDYFAQKLTQIREDAAQWGDLADVINTGPGETIDEALNSKDNRDALMKFIEPMDFEARVGMFDVHPEGGPVFTKIGAQRVRNAVLARTLTDPELVFELSEGV